ncbi:tautomerase family protein [Mucilaginibacter sp. OK098]|uniref:tautomerase family protein n=1 Tax=Mucilaginibacter sp. OK098 TaxID=1855297 RepID=UPI00091E69B0|nr:tautomerase family protein [Mucilaginibacter sp. OK098]SHN35467.1 Tautomerase enzyme [Mucilaginibacter sp. OK098]
MPFVQIYLPATFTSAQKKTISVSIQESLVAIFNVPEKDYFQVINILSDGHLIHSDSYLDIPHTDQMVYIYITCALSRTKEMKQALYASIAQKIAAGAAVNINDVFIILNEIPWENWSFGQGKAQMIHKSTG